MGATPPQEEAGIFKRGADLILVLQFPFRAVQNARHPSEASQFSHCCPGKLFDVSLVSQLAVKSGSQDLQLWLRRQLCPVKGRADVMLRPEHYEQLCFLSGEGDLPSASPVLQAA